ncbi:hypothetical protein J2S54_004276 [Streptomyces sp. DSM 42143]|nr:hypothetical protein [Streptomyces sp. DSM 42143]
MRGPVLGVRPGPVAGGRLSAGLVRARGDRPGEPGGRPPGAVDRTVPPPGLRGGAAPGTRDAESVEAGVVGVGATAVAGVRRGGRDWVLVMTLRMGAPRFDGPGWIPGSNLRLRILYGLAGWRGKEERGRGEGPGRFTYPG